MDQRVSASEPRAKSAASRWLVAVLTAALVCPISAADYRYSKGDDVTIQGRVVDSNGVGVASATVLLELSRTKFQILQFKKVKSSTLRIPVTSGDQGQYLHKWRWDGFYNTFELAVAMPVTIDGREDYEVVHRVEITPQVRQGSPVEASLVLQDTDYLEWLRRFSNGLASSEEKRIFQELGRPDRIDAYDEGAFAWWYFQIGKVYRFRKGEIEQIEPFDPIQPP
ncbi:MAG: hypothetical protein AAF560_28065 [Acidobacteriota bacterium]